MRLEKRCLNNFRRCVCIIFRQEKTKLTAESPITYTGKIAMKKIQWNVIVKPTNYTFHKTFIYDPTSFGVTAALGDRGNNLAGF
jgi:hypothetical protein